MEKLILGISILWAQKPNPNLTGVWGTHVEAWRLVWLKNLKLVLIRKRFCRLRWKPWWHVLVARFPLASTPPVAKSHRSLPEQLFFEVHFRLWFSVGTYSWSSRLQICCRRCLTWVHDVDFRLADSCKRKVGTFAKGRPKRKWLGVRGSSSFLSLLTWVKGLEFTRHSASVTMVEKTSGVNFAEPRLMRRTRLTIWTSQSQTPPKWGAEGGISLHSMDWLRRLFLMKSWSSWSCFRRNCLRDPKKFVALSDIKTRGWPRLEISRLIAVIHLLVDKSSAISRWMTCVTRRVKRQMFVFTSLFPCITANGPR